MVVRSLNSRASSLRKSSICFNSNSLITIRFQVWLARISAAYISFNAAGSPNACGMTLVRRRSSPNSRSRRLRSLAVEADDQQIAALNAQLDVVTNSAKNALADLDNITSLLTDIVTAAKLLDAIISAVAKF
jgi:hypothetical protein